MKPLFLLSLVFLLSCESTKTKHEETTVLPSTLDEAVEDIISVLSEEDKAKVRETKFCDLIMFHHGWGTGIRNSYGLWRGNTDLLESTCGSPNCHPDESSMVIIYAVWNTLNGNPIRHKPMNEDQCVPDWIKDLDQEENS